MNLTPDVVGSILELKIGNNQINAWFLAIEDVISTGGVIPLTLWSYAMEMSEEIKQETKRKFSSDKQWKASIQVCADQQSCLIAPPLPDSMEAGVRVTEFDMTAVNIVKEPVNPDAVIQEPENGNSKEVVVGVENDNAFSAYERAMGILE